MDGKDAERDPGHESTDLSFLKTDFLGSAVPFYHVTAQGKVIVYELRVLIFH